MLHVLASICTCICKWLHEGWVASHPIHPLCISPCSRSADIVDGLEQSSPGNLGPNTSKVYSSNNTNESARSFNTVLGSLEAALSEAVQE